VRFRFVRDHAERFSVERMCQALQVSRSGYYAWCRRPESRRAREDRRLAVEIRATHRRNREVYGSPRIHKDLRERGLRCSRKRVARLMREEGVRAKQSRKFRPLTTDSRHTMPIAPNVLDRNFEASSPNQAWVADITYIPTREGWLYLAVILDLFSRAVVGWAMDARCSRGLVIRALQMALVRRRPSPGLVHHSDRGSQYASADYRALLAQQGLICSMSRRGDCYDNAAMESFYHTLKTEHVHFCDYVTRRQAMTDLFDYIEVFYNRQRRHSFLDHVSPMAFEDAHRAA
jgi:putative transposase